MELEQIKIIISQKMDFCDLPDSYYEYIANIIVEEPPHNEADLLLLLKDFINNKEEYEEEDQMKITKEIYKLLNEKKLLNFEGTLTWGAEKLNQPITMKNVNLISDQEILAGYKDTPFLVERLFFSNDLINNEDSKNIEQEIEERRKKDKELKEKLEKEKYLKTLEEMKKHSRRLPPVECHHRDKASYSMEINVDNFGLDIGGKLLLEDTNLCLSIGRKYGLIGRNGTGKTTLLYALIRKEIENMNTDPQILMVEQEITGDNRTTLETILEVDSERMRLLKEEKDILDGKGDEDRLAEVYERLNAIDADKSESKAIILLKGLGFSDEMINNPTLHLSGGWRMRVALAKVLFCKPDILLLDEPTNHLDLDAVLWLQDYLQKWENTLLVVSHAREFLNSVCTDIIHLTDYKLVNYKGNFDNFQKVRNDRLIQRKRDIEKQTNKINHMKQFIDRFRAKASKASIVQSRIKAMEKIDILEDIKEDPTCVFDFGIPEKARPPIIRIDNGSFGYNKNNILLDGLNFSVEMESKIALLGANGAGKTTFLKLLTKDLELIDGNYYKNNKCRISFFSQHHVEKLDLALSALEQFSKLFPLFTIEQIRSHLGKFGMIGDLALRPMYVLSGGQKSRVSLALAAWNNPQLLIMDEPTNHLDMEAVNALILALNEYTGGLIIVSHDQYFVSCVCDIIWYIKNRKMKRFQGDFESYKISLAANTL